MLTTGLLSSIALVTLVASGVIGLIVGFITCWVLKVSWNAKMAVTDTMLTVAMSIAAAFAFAAIALARGHFDGSVGWILLIASGSVVIRHLVRRGYRPAV
jgi:hypothetical protein